MAGTMTAAAAHKQYEEGIGAFRRHIADPVLRQQLGAPVCVLENTGEALAEALLNGVGGETWHK